MSHVTDPRNGFDLTQIQDENGTDLLLLRDNLQLSVEERLVELEARVRFAEQIQRVTPNTDSRR